MFLFLLPYAFIHSLIPWNGLSPIGIYRFPHSIRRNSALSCKLRTYPPLSRWSDWRKRWLLLPHLSRDQIPLQTTCPMPWNLVGTTPRNASWGMVYPFYPSFRCGSPLDASRLTKGEHDEVCGHGEEADEAAAHFGWSGPVHWRQAWKRQSPRRPDRLHPHFHSGIRIGSETGGRTWFDFQTSYDIDVRQINLEQTGPSSWLRWFPSSADQ